MSSSSARAGAVWSFWAVHTVAAATAWGSSAVLSLSPFVGRSMLSVPMAALMAAFAAEGAYARTIWPNSEFPPLLAAVETLITVAVTAAGWAAFQGPGVGRVFLHPAGLLSYELLLWVASVLFVRQLSGILACDQAMVTASDYSPFVVERATRRFFRMVAGLLVINGFAAEYSPPFFGAHRSLGLLMTVAGLGAVVLHMLLLGRLQMKRRMHAWRVSKRHVDARFQARWTRLLVVLVLIAVVAGAVLPTRYSPMTISRVMEFLSGQLTMPGERSVTSNSVAGGLPDVVDRRLSVTAGIVVTLATGLIIYAALMLLLIVLWLLKSTPYWLYTFVEHLVDHWIRLWGYLRELLRAIGGRSEETEKGFLAATGGVAAQEADRPGPSWARRSRRHQIRYLFYRFVRQASRSHAPFDPSNTASEYGRIVVHMLEPNDARELSALTDAYTNARYAEPEPEPDLVQKARNAWKQVRRALTRRP